MFNSDNKESLYLNITYNIFFEPNRKLIQNLYISDITAPSLSCPNNITVNSDPGASYASVSWAIPQPQGM